MFLADDNLIAREGVKALLEFEDDFDVVGQGADYDELVQGAESTKPQVIVTDIRMPPDFSREGIDAAKEVRKRNPGTGVVILSQFDDPDYVVALLSEGAAGYAYLLKDRVGEGVSDPAPGPPRRDRAHSRRCRSTLPPRRSYRGDGYSTGHSPTPPPQPGKSRRYRHLSTKNQPSSIPPSSTRFESTRRRTSSARLRRHPATLRG